MRIRIAIAIALAILLLPLGLATSQIIAPPEAARGKRADAATPPAQIGSDAKPASDLDQISTSSKSVDSVDVIVRKSDANAANAARDRTVDMSALGGFDRCDQADAALDPACALIIEQRANDFARTDKNILSPEQRLLVEQRARRSGAAAERSSVRDLAGQGAALDLDAQGIASVVLPKPETPDPTTEKTLDASNLGDVTDAIVSGVITLPPPEAAPR
jgi:hypothetical protein